MKKEKVNKKENKNISDGDKISLLNPVSFFRNFDKATPKQISAVIMVAVILVFMAFGIAMISVAFSFRGYIYIETSYKIELTVDSRDTVTAVNFLNQESKQAFKDTDLTNISTESALQKILSYEVESRRFTEDSYDNLLFIRVTNKNTEYTIQDLERYISYIQHYLDERKISAFVNTDCFTEYEITRSNEYKITPESYRLIVKTAELLSDYDLKYLLSLNFEDGVRVYNRVYKAKYLSV